MLYWHGAVAAVVVVEEEGAEQQRDGVGMREISSSGCEREFPSSCSGLTQRTVAFSLSKLHPFQSCCLTLIGEPE